MNESLFIRLVKYFYGINKPFDEFTNKVISEAVNKVAFGLIIFLFASIFVSLGIGNFDDTSDIAIGMIFADAIAVLIALTYMDIVVKRHGLDEYDYSNDSERKIAIRSFIIQNLITLVAIMTLLICFNLILGGGFDFIFFVIYPIGFVFSMYLGYRRKFK
ncbi:DUF3278 domain-containing protein [Apilactobacillus kunkeei]|uniref:DUF3278 domain-containing protein n=1 Tax=Apilactobacillus kunkeei TaxID=148814 RepID=UPI0006C22E80|nr:DUF3278 domain-containing protein [Apilactobacillus kunkeei]KOY70783.1 hypothetical protein RZ55_03480 [Apilactobacillus kunkeei]